jgi:hypothetical protein
MKNTSGVGVSCGGTGGKLESPCSMLSAATLEWQAYMAAPKEFTLAMSALSDKPGSRRGDERLTQSPEVS